jgi:hypothetical protein
MKATLRALSKTAANNYSEEDHRLLQCPSVEDHLTQILRALALNAMIQNARAQGGDLGLTQELENDAAAVVAELTESAWRCAAALKDALPVETQILVVDEVGRTR